jgi:hypothetical protein
VPGGGTVSYVNATEHRYLEDIEHREEGGTPAIVESIRCGLVFKLKETVGTERIRALEHGFITRAIERWSQRSNIEVLGSRRADRLSIVSFVVRHGDQHLHHNFVVALLNDMFGIQSRGGCSCAGPYGHRLLGIDLETSQELEQEIAQGCEGIKPGWVRVNFNYFITEAVFEYILSAVELVASDGWRMLPDYRFEVASGLWRHRDGLVEPPLRLTEVEFTSAGIEHRPHRVEAGDEELAAHLVQSQQILTAGASHRRGCGMPEVSEHFESLRWFPLPDEAVVS